MASAPAFIIPQKLIDLEPENPSEDRYYACDLLRAKSVSQSEADAVANNLLDDLCNKEILDVLEQNVLDELYTFLKYYAHIDHGLRGRIIETLKSNMTLLLGGISKLVQQFEDAEPAELQESINLHRNGLKAYFYFLQSMFLLEDAQPEPNSRTANLKGKNAKKKHMGQPKKWEDARVKVLQILATAVLIDLKQLYGQSNPEESFLAFIAKSAFSMLENPALLRDKESKNALCSIVAAVTTKYEYTAQTHASILDLIHKCEHLPQHIAEIVAYAEKQQGDGRLATALIREIGKMNPKEYARDTSGAENVGRFLVELADRMPKLVATNVGMLIPHFGGESYKIRSALVGVLGKLIAKAFRDIDNNSSNGIHRLRSKQAMLDVLIERCRDVSAYTRSRVLQTWSELCEEHAISMGLWNTVSEIAAGRLEDKSAMVRKSALNLLTTLLQYNPFGPQLRTAAFEATLETYKRKLAEMQPQRTSNDQEGVGVTVETEKIEGAGVTIKTEKIEVASDDNEKDQDFAGEDISCIVDNDISQNAFEDSGPSQVEYEKHRDENTPDMGGLEQTRALVASLQVGLSFAKCMSATMPILVQLLASPIATDVEHAIQFLMRCRQFQIEGADSSLRKMFPLVFSQEKAISEAVENAFVSIYIRKSSMDTAANLISITLDASIGDLAALESIISALVTKGDISSATISALWDFFTFNVNGVTVEQSRGALSVLCIAANSNPKVLGPRLLNIIDIGFGRRAKEEPLLARTACVALQRITEEDRKNLVMNSGRIFNVLESLIIGSTVPEQSWYSAAEQAINAIYALHPTPEIFAANLIKKLHSIVFGQIQARDGVEVAEGENVSLESGMSVQVLKLGRYLFVIGHVALKHLVYVESCVRKVRKQRAAKERAAAEANAAKLNEIDTSENSGEASQEVNINAELGVTASEDAKLDSLAEKVEKEIVSGGQNEKFLIGLCAPVVAKLCRNYNLLEKFPGLQAPAMLALCKLMVIDVDFCEANLQLLFTVAQNATADTVRSNCVIALGDLAVRFPNLLEPWTEHMYARLHDESLSVRKNAVLVLSHLILNDMMKVKGYISEMALCLEDDDVRISNLAKLFFHELSKKGNNPIYNLLPDILSRISIQNIPEDHFCNIMQFLIGFIKKDKQMEGLIEKLCHRFYGVTNKKQWVDLAYCLSQLNYTEKGFKKLAELFKSYENSLAEDAVISYFKNIINKTKKFAKPEFKSAIEDFEEKLTKCHEERKEQEETLQNAMSHHQKVTAATMEPNKSDAERGNQDCPDEADSLNKSDLASADISDSQHLQAESTAPSSDSCAKKQQKEKSSDEDGCLTAQSETSTGMPNELPEAEGDGDTLQREYGEEAQSHHTVSPSKEDTGSRITIKGMPKRKKALSIKLQKEEHDGVIEEEKENTEREVKTRNTGKIPRSVAPKTPKTVPSETSNVRITRKTPKDQIPPSTMSRRKRG